MQKKGIRGKITESYQGRSEFLIGFEENTKKQEEKTKEISNFYRAERAAWRLNGVFADVYNE